MLLNISTHSLHIRFVSALWGTFIRLYFHNFGTHILRRLPANLQVVKTRTAQFFPRRRACVIPNPNRPRQPFSSCGLAFASVRKFSFLTTVDPSQKWVTLSPVSEARHLYRQFTHQFDPRIKHLQSISFTWRISFRLAHSPRGCPIGTHRMPSFLELPQSRHQADKGGQSNSHAHPTHHAIPRHQDPVPYPTLPLANNSPDMRQRRDYRRRRIHQCIMPHNLQRIASGVHQRKAILCHHTQTSEAAVGSYWSAARFGGSSPATFQTRVLHGFALVKLDPGVQTASYSRSGRQTI